MPLRIFLILAPLVAIFSLYLAIRQNATPQRTHTIRSAAARRAFRRQQPCPATGYLRGPCPGYVIDHVKPLACGGEDAPYNMQWQTKEDAKEKDKMERKDCGK